MNKILIKIDLTTVTLNPQAGKTTTLIQGVGAVQHPARPKYLYDYQDQVVQCSECNAQFHSSECLDESCPHCGEETITFEYQDPSDEELHNLIAQVNH